MLFPTLRPVNEVVPTRWEDRIGVDWRDCIEMLDLCISGKG
jgi:hypothetical protein